MIYAVGDVHGQHKMLLSLLDQIRAHPFGADDQLVFLGDYIDRGSDPKAVIDTLIRLRDTQPNTVFLRGNHEQMMLDARDKFQPIRTDGEITLAEDSPARIWFSLENGGRATLNSYGIDIDALNDEEYTRWFELIPEAHWSFLEMTTMDYITDVYHFVHAGLLPEGRGGEYWLQNNPGLDPRLWIRDPFLLDGSNYGGRLVVFGHTPQLTGRPLIYQNKVGIDTGAAFGIALTAAVLHPNKRDAPADHKFIHVKG